MTLLNSCPYYNPWPATFIPLGIALIVVFTPFILLEIQEYKDRKIEKEKMLKTKLELEETRAKLYQMKIV